MKPHWKKVSKQQSTTFCTHTPRRNVVDESNTNVKIPTKWIARLVVVHSFIQDQARKKREQKKSDTSHKESDEERENNEDYYHHHRRRRLFNVFFFLKLSSSLSSEKNVEENVSNNFSFEGADKKKISAITTNI